ncbi:MAG: hypothetical protein PHR82_04130 [Endomicrobiaceae bacterium]|nr:hypothetical protein [Endomicrobiaceae bacterium]
MPSPDKDIKLQEQVQSLYEMMQEEKVEELEIKSPDLKLHIRRKGRNVVHQISHQHVSGNLGTQHFEQSPETPKIQSVEGDTKKSPITGMFYRSPSPSLPMFVKEGDIVDTGKTLCIIEAMKVMNEIKATEKIKIVNILVENGKPVERDQDLFIIEKL